MSHVLGPAEFECGFSIGLERRVLRESERRKVGLDHKASLSCHLFIFYSENMEGHQIIYSRRIIIFVLLEAQATVFVEHRFDKSRNGGRETV